MVRIIFCTIAVCVLITVLKGQIKDFVLPVELVFICLAVALIYDEFSYRINSIFDLADELQLNSDIFASLIKGALICLITNIASDICCDKGNKALSDIIQISGKLAVTALAFPYIETVLRISTAFVK